MKIIPLSFIVVTMILSSCNNDKNEFDATGAFEAEETIISAEATGTIKEFKIEEGQQLHSGEFIGYIDSVQLDLKKKQLDAQIKALLSKRPNVSLQLAALQEQLKTAEKDQARIANLVKAEAATTKQLDDINGNIEVLKKQIAAQHSNLEISSTGISSEATPIQIQVEQIKDQLQKCRIINPVNGTVLAKYAMVNEMASQGKPLYKIADLSNIILRAYITGSQFSKVKTGMKVKVLTDDGKGDYKEAEGTLIWISDKAEFTPKTIQTKDERANMVYAVKIKVKNDGTYKIGMYAEIKFP